MRRTQQLRRAARATTLSLLLSAALLSPRVALAGPKDADGLIAVAEAMNEFMEGKYDEGLGRLDDALKTCRGHACDASVRAQIHMAAGILWGAGRGSQEESKAAFERALREDPTTTLDRQWATKDVEKAFAQAKAAVKAGPSPDFNRPGPTKEQSEALALAESQLAQKDWSTCMQTLIEAMVTAEFAAGKLTLARCEDAGGLMLEAMTDATAGARFAEEEGNSAAAADAADLIDRLKNDTPTIALVIPKSMSDVEVKVDGVVLSKDKASEPIPHNPGKATIEVTGKKGRFPTTFKTTEPIGRGEQITINVDQGGGQNNSAVLQCILSARTPADVNLCIETGGKGRGFTFKSGLEVSTYNDNDNTGVTSPAIFLSGENPTAGWQIGGSFLVDVVTTASTDIVASASRRLDEVRYAATLAGDYKIGPAKVGLNGGISIEPDYVARSIGVALGADLFEKMVTPGLAYQISFDTQGRSGTPFDVFSEDLMRHTIDAGVSFVIDASTIVVGGATLEIASGDASKPYRHVPLFSKATAEKLPNGASAKLVSDNRLDPFPLEQLPDSRMRMALFGRASHRFESATLRGDERLYIDTWGQKASTTDGRFLIDITERFRVGPHLRFNIQGPVDFWKRAYTAVQTSGGWKIPQYRTTDRELGPLFGVTLGGSVRYAITESFGAGLQVEGVYTSYLDHIYLQDRLGIFTATTLDLEIE